MKAKINFGGPKLKTILVWNAERENDASTISIGDTNAIEAKTDIIKLQRDRPAELNYN